MIATASLGPPGAIAGDDAIMTLAPLRNGKLLVKIDKGPSLLTQSKTYGDTAAPISAGNPSARAAAIVKRMSRSLPSLLVFCALGAELAFSARLNCRPVIVSDAYRRRCMAITPRLS